jgi:hypothetical protein
MDGRFGLAVECEKGASRSSLDAMTRRGRIVHCPQVREERGQGLLDDFELEPLEPPEPEEPDDPEPELDPPEPESPEPLLELFESPPELLDPLEAASLDVFDPSELLDSDGSFDFTESAPSDEPLRLSVR